MTIALNWELFIAFCGASIALGLLPGPAVGAISSVGLAHGTRAAMMTVAGGLCAAALHMVLVVAATASLFLFLEAWMPLIRWLGVAYLLYLGVQSFLPDRSSARDGAPEVPGNHALFLRGFIANATNPKALGFIAAFFPQFVDAALPVGPQIAMMSASYLIILIIVDTGWGFASGAGNRLFQSKRAKQIKSRISGSIMVGAAAALATVRS